LAKYSDPLKRRLGTFLDEDKFRVIKGNCNEEIAEVVSDIKRRFKKPIILAFVDPEGMEIKLETLKTLSSNFRSVDFMINVNAQAERVAATIRSGIKENVPIFNDYFGEQGAQVLLDLAKGAKVDERYGELVREVLGRQVGYNIPIYERGNIIKYYILGYTRQSASGSRWAEVWRHTRAMLDGVDGEEARKTLDLIKRRGESLDKYSRDC